VKTKPLPTATKLLYKTQEIFDTLDQLRKNVDLRYRAAFSVTFYHNEDRTLVFTKWSDQYYGADLPKDYHFEYSYEVTSRGISFTGFAERKKGGQWWESERSWYLGGHESTTMTLLQVPNIPPPNSGRSMYLFHQEKIREALSALPAWAILCGTDY